MERAVERHTAGRVLALEQANAQLQQVRVRQVCACVCVSLHARVCVTERWRGLCVCARACVRESE